MKRWVTFFFSALFLFSLTYGEGKTPQRHNLPNTPVRKEAVKSASKQKDFKDLSPAQQEKWLAAKENAALKEGKKPAKGADTQQVIPFGNTYSKTNPTQTSVGEKAKVSVSTNVKPGAASKSKSINDVGLFFEDFEGSPTEEPFTLPEGWTDIPTPGGNGWTTAPLYDYYTGPIPGHSGTRYADILYHASIPHNAWAITPAISLVAGKSYKISFWVLIIGYGSQYERLEVKLGTAPNSAGLTTLVYDNGQTNVTAWTEISYSYTPTTTGNYYLGFHSISPADVNATYFDDVKVEEIVLTVPAAPTNFTVTPGENGALSAKLEWTNPSLTKGGDALTSLTSIVIERDGEPLHTITTGLTPGASLDWTDTTPTNGDHTYTIYATNSDGSSDAVSQTVFVGIDPCTIPIPAIGYSEDLEDLEALGCWWIYNLDEGGSSWGISTNYSHSGAYSLAHLYSAGNQNGWVVSPLINIPDGKVLSLSFWSYNNYPNDYTPERNAKNSVWISTGSSDPRDGDFVEVWTPSSVTNTWEKTEINLGAYSGNIYIAFRYEGNIAHDWFIDDLSLSELLGADAGVTAITSPVSGVLTGSETITVKVKNFGAEALANVPVKVTIDGGAAISESISAIAVGAEVEHTFTPPVDLSVAKPYQIKAYTEVTDDVNPSNDTTVTTVTNIGDCVISQLPYNEGVEDDARLLCWHDFYYDTDGPATGWAPTTSLFHTGARSVYHSYNFEAAQDGWLVSPKIQIPDDGIYSLSFWSYVLYPNDYGKNTLWISTDSGDPEDNDFVEVWTPAEASIVQDWVEVKINLADYAGEEIYIAFQYEGTNAHVWYLDDLEIKKLPDYDAGVTEISSPRSGTNLTVAEKISVKVKNWGAQTLNNVPVFVEIDGGTPISGTISSIAVAGEEEYEFTQTADLSAVKSYTIKAYTSYPADADLLNDTVTTIVTNDGNLAVIGNSASITTCNIQFVDDGKDEDYSASLNETQTITFYPATTGDRLKAEFNSFASYPYELVLGILPYPGDTLFVYNGNTVDESQLLGALTDDLTDALPAPFRSIAADGSLTFVFKKHSGEALAGWDATISCFTPLAHDASVVEILSPKTGGESAAQVKVNIANYGANPITSTDVAYTLNGGAPVTETVTTTIAVGETYEYTFTETVDVSEYADYTLTAYTLLTDDGDPTNDTASVSFSYKESITLYGYRIYNDTWDSVEDIELGIVSFETADPSDVKDISDYTDGDNTIYAGAYVDGYLYAYSVTVGDYSVTPANFIKLNTGDWTDVSKVPATAVPNDLTYDYSTGTLYAISTEAVSDETTSVLLQTVNPETGALTTVVPITGVEHLFTLAADLAGNLYGVDYYGDLVSINKTTGAATVIGSTGIKPSYIQSMTFDHNTGRLLWAMCNTADEGRLIELDPATGEAIDWGVLGGNAEVVALYTIYTHIIAPELVSINIEDGATEVEPELSIILTFDKEITSSDLSGITLTKNGTTETVTVTPSIAGSVLTIAHDKLAGETLYDLLIPAGTIDDYDAEIALSFTTKNYVALPSLNVRSFNVFPNPAKNVVYVSQVTENSVISILDLAGRTLESQPVAKSDKDVKVDLHFAPGVYFIQIESDHTKVIQKLIIK